MRFAVIAVAIVALAVGIEPAAAQLRPSGPPPNCFSVLEQKTVFDYFGIKRPPSSRCRRPRGTLLAPGAGERDLPDDLVRRLPPLPDGRRRVIVGDAVILMDSHTRAVLDRLPGVAARSAR